jgi:hypothetical protein
MAAGEQLTVTFDLRIVEASRYPVVGGYSIAGLGPFKLTEMGVSFYLFGKSGSGSGSGPGHPGSGGGAGSLSPSSVPTPSDASAPPSTPSTPSPSAGSPSPSAGSPSPAVGSAALASDHQPLSNRWLLVGGTGVALLVAFLVLSVLRLRRRGPLTSPDDPAE